MHINENMVLNIYSKVAHNFLLASYEYFAFGNFKISADFFMAQKMFFF